MSLAVGADVSIESNKYKVDQELKKLGITHDEAKLNKCIGEYGVIEEISKDETQVKVKFRHAGSSSLWFPATCVDVEDESSTDLAIDEPDEIDAAPLKRPGGSDLILVAVGMNDPSARQSSRSFASVNTYTTPDGHNAIDLHRRNSNTARGRPGQSNPQGRGARLSQIRDVSDLKIEDEWRKNDKVWRLSEEGHYVESVIVDIQDDPKDKTRKQIKVDGVRVWIDESKLSRTQPTEYDIGYITSAPLVYYPTNMREPVPMDELNLTLDERLIRKCLKNSGLEFKVKKCAATPHNLLSLCNKGCNVIHYSGHGVKGFLAFENHSKSELGNTQFINNEYLQRVLRTKAGYIGVKLAVVSACHSEKAGQAFVQAGVPHVIAIKQNNAVHDQAAHNFTETFYEWLFSGNSVNTAYKAALNAVEGAGDSSRHDRGIYLLLPKTSRHEEVLFQNKCQGEFAFEELVKLAPSNLPAAPSIFYGRAVIQREVCLSVLNNKCTLVHGPSGVGKSELVKMAARYIHERGLDEFSKGVVWVNIKKRYEQTSLKVNDQGPGESRADKTFTLYSILKEACVDVLPTLRKALEEPSYDNETGHNLGYHTPGRNRNEERRFFNAFPEKVVVVIRGLEYLTDRNDIQDTLRTIQELRGSAGDPTILMTHLNGLKNNAIMMNRIAVPELDKDSSANLFCSKVTHFWRSELKHPLAPPKRFQVRWKDDKNGQYQIEYFNKKREVLNRREALMDENVDPEVRDCAGRDLPHVPDLPEEKSDDEERTERQKKEAGTLGFGPGPEEEKKSESDDEDFPAPKAKREVTRGKERHMDFLDWVTGNPARIVDVASFTKLREPPFESPWDVISQYTLFQKNESLRLILEFKPLAVGGVDNHLVKRMFSRRDMVNKERRLVWPKLKEALELRFKNITGRRLLPFDWKKIKDLVLVKCTSNASLSISIAGFAIFMDWFMQYENRTIATFREFSEKTGDIRKLLVEEYSRASLSIIVMNNLDTLLVTDLTHGTKQMWDRSLLPDLRKRIALEHLRTLIPLVFWKLLPKGTWRIKKSQIDWLINNYILEKFVSRKSDQSVSFDGWASFFHKVLVPWRNMIDHEINMWNEGVFVGFCSDAQCRRWLKDKPPKTFVIRFSVSRMDVNKNSNAIAVTYKRDEKEILNSLVDFLGPPTGRTNCWSVPQKNRQPVKCDTLVEVMRQFDVDHGLNPFANDGRGKRHAVESFKKDNRIYVDHSGLNLAGQLTHGEGEAEPTDTPGVRRAQFDPEPEGRVSFGEEPGLDIGPPLARPDRRKRREAEDEYRDDSFDEDMEGEGQTGDMGPAPPGRNRRAAEIPAALPPARRPRELASHAGRPPTSAPGKAHKLLGFAANTATRHTGRGRR